LLDQSRIARRFHECESEWLRSFSLAHVKCLVVCRGPVRKEAFDVFDQIGIREYGMLLSEKDSVVYPRCLAPELRDFRFPHNVHRVPDYIGAGQEEKLRRIREIIEIAVQHGYTHLFAGYGFMAEDAEFIEAIERAGLGFVGPSSRVVHRAGAKDEAKKLARGLGNAVIPGVDNVSALALGARVKDRASLEELAAEKGLDWSFAAGLSLEANAMELLQAGYAASQELVTIEELQRAAETECRRIWADHPGRRIRFKHIAGGGGKGQRVVGRPEEVAAAVLAVLAESKVTAPGSNRNFLIELNIESTRHNEIQLIGNGEWCLSLGGRDCSVQMHEQKLLEVSLTQELLDAEIELARARGEDRAVEILSGDKRTLARMEAESERFGLATGLDSVSTFECIVSGFDHFFMEMNTRIQVEHGVTELVYELDFENPALPTERFTLDRLIEAMLLLSVHGARVPCPVRRPRAVSGIEVRVNATNAALQPHAGGLIRGWSEPIPGEIRFDQGIGLRNPDTGSFVYYNLAGAYDSNVALVLCEGANRRENLARMAEVLRCMDLRGDDLQTNAPLHYGLVSWFLGRGYMAEPTTRFMGPYLGAVGALQELVAGLDLEVAWEECLRRQPDADARQVLAARQTLLLRPLQRLFANAHLLAGFAGRFDGELWERSGDDVRFRANPVRVLDELHHYLALDWTPEKPPSEKIWDHDHAVLQAARDFYARVEEKLGTRDWRELAARLEGPRQAALAGGDDLLWRAVQAAHRGHQLGSGLLLLPARIALRSGFAEIGVDAGLQVVFPERFLDAEAAARHALALAPAPRASADEIVAPMGGSFYAREAPHLPPLVEVGDHFEAGQPLFIIEVMKMFNKVLAPFAGTVTANLMHDRESSVVKKGQPIFKIEPDQRIAVESPELVARRRREATLALLTA